MRTYIHTLLALHATAWKPAQYDAYRRNSRNSLVFELEDELELEAAIEEPSFVPEEPSFVPEEPSLVTEEPSVVNEIDQMIDVAIESILNSSFQDDAGRAPQPPPKEYIVQPTGRPAIRPEEAETEEPQGQEFFRPLTRPEKLASKKHQFKHRNTSEPLVDRTSRGIVGLWRAAINAAGATANMNGGGTGGGDGGDMGGDGGDMGGDNGDGKDPNLVWRRCTCNDGASICQVSTGCAASGFCNNRGGLAADVEVNPITECG